LKIKIAKSFLTDENRETFQKNPGQIIYFLDFFAHHDLLSPTGQLTRIEWQVHDSIAKDCVSQVPKVPKEPISANWNFLSK
jgi:hypothetical protein